MFQSYCRGYLARKECKHRLKSIIKIQAGIRMVLAKRTAQELRIEVDNLVLWSGLCLFVLLLLLLLLLFDLFFIFPFPFSFVPIIFFSLFAFVINHHTSLLPSSSLLPSPFCPSPFPLSLLFLLLLLLLLLLFLLCLCLCLPCLLLLLLLLPLSFSSSYFHTLSVINGCLSYLYQLIFMLHRKRNAKKRK